MYKPISQLYKNGSTNTVESSLPKLKTSKLSIFQKVSKSLAKIYAFHFAEMSGLPCLNMKLRLTIIVKICQNACACIFHILAEHWFLISILLSVPDIFHFSSYGRTRFNYINFQLFNSNSHLNSVLFMISHLFATINIMLHLLSL